MENIDHTTALSSSGEKIWFDRVEIREDLGNNQCAAAAGSGTEDDLIAALNNLRNSLPNAMVTTITYKPLIGPSTITDVQGNKVSYYYDSSNRLQFIKDTQGNILSENQYHFRP
jgi:YD repeat-containing protein